MTQRQRAVPIVLIETEMTGASVRMARVAARGDVEASLPKSGVQMPASPAC